jgi:hypothetical protein
MRRPGRATVPHDRHRGPPSVRLQAVRQSACAAPAHAGPALRLRTSGSRSGQSLGVVVAPQRRCAAAQAEKHRPCARRCGRTPPLGWRGQPPRSSGALPRCRRQCSAVPPIAQGRAQGPPALRRLAGTVAALPLRHLPGAPALCASGRSAWRVGDPPPAPHAARPQGCGPLAGGCPSFLSRSGGWVMVGFTGSRSLSSQFAPLVGSIVAAVSGPVAVGCAPGADTLVRSAAGARAQVFRASAFAQPGAPFSAALVARSVALVRAVAASPSPLMVGFVSAPCPAGLFPSPQPSACFCGRGSGSWATLALAVGLGVPVRVFPCGFAAASLPASWGVWSSVSGPPVAGRPAALAAWAGAWQLQPAVSQPSLF